MDRLTASPLYEPTAEILYYNTLDTPYESIAENYTIQLVNVFFDWLHHSMCQLEKTLYTSVAEKFYVTCSYDRINSQLHIAMQQSNAMVNPHYMVGYFSKTPCFGAAVKGAVTSK